MSGSVSEMKYVIVYWSRYGNGKKLVDHLAATLQTKGAQTQVLTTDEANPAALPPADVYVFSAAVEAMNIQKNMRGFMKRLQGMAGKNYGIINTHGMPKNRLPKMEKFLSIKDMVKLAEIDFLVGKEAQTGNGLPTGWETALDEYAARLTG